MKKNIIIAILFLGSLAQAQRNNHEVSVDLADALVMKTLEISYEHYLSEQSSVGLSGLFNFEKEVADFRYNEKKVISPFFRHYFSDSSKWNYLGEVFFGVNSGRYKNADGIFKDYTDGALGVSVGSKYISAGGFVITAIAGIGRNMFSDNSPMFVPRAGLNIGYRF